MNTLKEKFNRIISTLRASLSSPRTLAVLLVCILIISAFVYFSHRSNETFAKEYAAYASLADENDNTTFIPGAASNPVRQQLNQILTQVLAQQMKAPEREALAQQGLALLQDSKKQIDAISDTSGKIDTLIAQMQVDSLNNFVSSDAERQVLVLAKKRSSVVSDIRAYSYRADFEIEKIFNRIIADKGALTDTYVTDLNNEIPVVEQQFNKRSDLYNELEGMSQKIADAYAGRNISTSPSQGQ